VTGVSGGDQIFPLQVSEDGAPGGRRNRMSVVGKAVEEGARAIEGVNYILCGEDGAERGVSTGKAFGGNQDIWVYLPMIDRDVAFRAANPGHDFIRDDEHSILAADFSDRLQVSWRWNDGAERRAAKGRKNEGGSLPVGGANCALQFGSVLLAAVSASVGTVEGAGVAIRHGNVGELFHQRTIDFTPGFVARD
jgi:hypothetical protein